MTDDAMWTPSTVSLAERIQRVESTLAAAALDNLAAALIAAALEELRVRAAVKRVSERYGHELRAARRMVPR